MMHHCTSVISLKEPVLFFDPVLISMCFHFIGTKVLFPFYYMYTLVNVYVDLVVFTRIAGTS